MVRLDLQPAPEARPLPERTSVAAYQVMTELPAWEIEAPRIAPFHMTRDGRGVGPELLGLEAVRRAQEIRLARSGSYDPRAFNQVRVTLSFRGIGVGPSIRASLLREGRDVVVSEYVALADSSAPAPVEINLPQTSAVQLCDGLALTIAGGNRRVGILGVELIHVPPVLRVPDATGPAELVMIDGEARRADCVVTGRPVTAQVAVPDGAVLTFSYAQATELGGDGSSSLRLELDRSGGTDRAVMHLAAPGQAGGWQPMAVPLAEYAGGSLNLRFDVDAKSEMPAGWFVANVAVWVPGRSAPSVLLVTSDTHRADHIGAARRTVGIATPALDALAARGVLFEDCFSTTNVTNPSHMAMLSGLHPRDTGVLVNRRALSEDVRTLAEVFRDAGYVTYAAVSVSHLGHDRSGLGQGFDRMSWPGRKPRRSAETVAMAQAWLRDVGRRPVFLWVHVFDAHVPYDPPREFDRAYYGEGDPFDPALPDPGIPQEWMPNSMGGLRDVEFARAQYKAEVTYLDSQLGRLFREDRFRAGIIAVTGDHGEALGQHSVFFGHAELYPETVRVPLILAWDGGPGGARVDTPVTNLGLGRTLLELAGLDPSALPGASLIQRPASGGGALGPRYLVSSWGQSASVQSGDLYLILHLGAHHNKRSSRAYEHHEVQLFDLSEDPDCEHELREERCGDAAKLRGHLIEWLNAAEEGGHGGPAIEDSDLLDQLAQLGYADGSDLEGPLWVEDQCDWCQRFP